MGFRFSPEFINFLVKKSDPQNHKEVSVDQFIVLCVQVQRFTEAFRQRDTQQNGTITIGFEDFLTVAIGCSYWKTVPELLWVMKSKYIPHTAFTDANLIPLS